MSSATSFVSQLMTEAYTPTGDYRLVVPVDGTDVRFAARYGLKWDIRKVPTRDQAAGPADHGAKVVVRVKCEIFPNCPRYVPDLMGASVTVPANPFVPRPGYEPPPPEWKSRDYLKDVLSKHDPHRKREA